jgi:hypothetical protein
MTPKKPKAKRVRIRGKYWRILVDKPPVKERIEGLCDYETRTIYLRPGTDLPATLFHEVLHACFPDLDEDSIAGAEEALVNAIFALKLNVNYEDTKTQKS